MTHAFFLHRCSATASRLSWLTLVALGATENGCSVYTDSLLEDAEGDGDLDEVSGGQITSASGGATNPGVGGSDADGGTGASGGAPAGGTNSGGEDGSGGLPSSGGSPASGGATNFEVCAIDPLVDPATLPACVDVGHPAPADGDLCTAGDDCGDEPCGFAGLGTKTCECKADGTFNCTCQRPTEYMGSCPDGVEGCTALNVCVRGPSCLDYDLENVGALQGTRAAMHGDLCADEWTQCTSVDAPGSDGCVCMKVSSSLPQWVCKDREGWFEPI